MNRAVFFLALCPIPAVAGSNLSAPLLGIVRDSHKHLRPVSGLGGNFVLRGAIGGTASNWAFCGSGGLVKADADLLVLDSNGSVIRRRPDPQSEVVLSPDSAFFPETGELWHANRAAWIEPAAIGGKVMALGTVGQRGIEMAICRADHLWLLTLDVKTGAVMREAVPGGAIGEQACRPAREDALLLLDDRLLLVIAHQLLIQTTAGVERHTSLPPSRRAQIHRAGEDWVEIELDNLPPKMIRINAEDETLYGLPVRGPHP
jgi:hypothetical protein